MSKDEFARKIVEELRNAKILGVRAGSEHRFTGVWVVVVDERVFVRSWNDKPTGWFRAFRDEPQGTIQVGERELPVRGKPVRGARLLDAITVAFGEKYNTKASRKWVEGFAEPARLATTLEFVPRISATRIKRSRSADFGSKGNQARTDGIRKKENTMKREYDFSKAEQGKFYRKGAVIQLPIYLNAKVQAQVERVARKNGKDVSELVNQVVQKEMELIEKLTHSKKHVRA